MSEQNTRGPGCQGRHPLPNTGLSPENRSSLSVSRLRALPPSPTPSARLAAALEKTGIQPRSEADLDRYAGDIARAMNRFTVRRLATKSTLERKNNWARSVEKHAKALADALSESDASIRCDLEDQIARIARKGTRDIPLPNESVAVLLDWANAANGMRKDCDLDIRKRDAELKRRKKEGLGPLLPAIEDGTALTEVIDGIADAFEGLSGQDPLSNVKSARVGGKIIKSGPFVDFVAKVWAVWCVDQPPSGSEIYLALSRRRARARK